MGYRAKAKEPVCPTILPKDKDEDLTYFLWTH